MLQERPIHFQTVSHADYSDNPLEYLPIASFCIMATNHYHFHFWYIWLHPIDILDFYWHMKIRSASPLSSLLWVQNIFCWPVSSPVPKWACGLLLLLLQALKQMPPLLSVHWLQPLSYTWKGHRVHQNRMLICQIWVQKSHVLRRQRCPWRNMHLCSMFLPCSNLQFLWIQRNVVCSLY